MENMNTEKLHETIKQIFTEGKGLLAADESTTSIHKRFEALGIAQTEENRLAYRKLLIATPDVSKYISGVIFYDETLRQEIEPGKTFAQYCTEHGIVPGIKVDKGLIDFPNFPGEKLTLGLDGLKERLEEYYKLGARFTKWRAVVDVTNSTDSGMEANMRNLALYASLAQEAGLVPIVEPEVLYDGTHSIYECEEKLQNTLTHLFGELALYKVDITGVILKTSFVLSGKKAVDSATHEEVAKHTADVLLSTVPKNIGGIVFLSGGQAPKQAALNLSLLMNHGPFPFPMTYSYSRAIQDPVLAHFAKDTGDTKQSQVILKDRLDMLTLALKGEYSVDKETGLSAEVEKVTGGQDL